MKIGICSDIHSNKPALEATLQDMKQNNVDVKVCLGDIVGYNAWPQESLELVRNNFDHVVQGNHDRNVQTPENYSGNTMAYEGLKHSQRQLTTEQIEWLNSLPLQETVTFDTNEYLLVHEHPDKSTLGTRESYVFPRHFSNILPHINGTTTDGIFLGHTHVRHTMKLNDKLVHNPGSVGQPRDGTIGSVYTILDTDSDTRFDVSKHVVEYDIDSVINKVKEVGLPVKSGNRLLNGE